MEREATGTQQASRERAEAALFEARQLGVRAGHQLLLDQVQLALHPGEITSVVGPSGCGKTTLLRALACLIEPARGELRLRGQAPRDVGYPEWRRRAVYVAQRPVLLAGSVQDNLSKPFEFRSCRGSRFDPGRALDVLERMAMPADCLDQEARTLSEGQQQRIGLLRALLVDPDVFLLDEPTSALDPDALARIEQLLRAEIARRDAAALVVTHDPGQAERLGQQVLALDDFIVARTVASRGRKQSDA